MNLPEEIPGEQVSEIRYFHKKPRLLLKLLL
jgi:hypothetical protein